MAWSQAHCRRLIAPALIWLLNVAFLVAVPYGEVRYMLILTPLTALLIVPPLRWLLVRRAGMAIAVVALVVTAAPGWGYGLAPQAARVASPFYSVNQARTFFEPVLRDFPPARTTIWNGRNLTFADATPSPLHGDRFNDLHHFAAAHLYLLLDYDADKITASEVGGLLDWPADSVLVTVEGGPLNNPMKGRLTASRRMKLRQTVATHQDLVLMPNEDGAGYRTHDGRPVEVSFVPGGIAIGTHPDEVAKATVWLSGEALAAEVRHMLHLRLRVAGLDGVRRAARGEDGRVAVPADDAFLAAIEARRPIKLYGFRIEHVHGFAEPGEPAVFATPTDTPELIDGIGRPGDGSRP